MFNDNHGKNVLFVISPATVNSLTLASCADAAGKLKDYGATRVDLSMDPRFENSLCTSHRLKNPLPEFSRVARSLASMIFGPVVGQSDVYEMPETRELSLLRQAGNMFTANIMSGNTILPENRSVGPDIGLIFHAAMNLKTANGARYDEMVMPLTEHGQNALHVFDDSLIWAKLPVHGEIIDLNGTRQRMISLRRPERPPEPLGGMN